MEVLATDKGEQTTMQNDMRSRSRALWIEQVQSIPLTPELEEMIRVDEGFSDEAYVATGRKLMSAVLVAIANELQLEGARHQSALPTTFVGCR